MSRDQLVEARACIRQALANGFTALWQLDLIVNNQAEGGEGLESIRPLPDQVSGLIAGFASVIAKCRSAPTVRPRQWPQSRNARRTTTTTFVRFIHIHRNIEGSSGCEVSYGVMIAVTVVR